MKYDTENIFWQIINKQIPCSLVYEDDMVLAFNDIYPAAPVHVLVIPKQQFISYSDFLDNAEQDLILHYFKTITKIVRDKDLEHSGYRLITNQGIDALQTVRHFHMHILGKAMLGPLVVGDLQHVSKL